MAKANTLSHELVYVATQTPARGEQIRQAIDLRDLDEVVLVSVPDLFSLLKGGQPPALIILDTEGDTGVTRKVMEGLPGGLPSLVLAERFDEDLFLTCHDHGARDFLVKPVPDAYLVSRVLSALQERRRQQVLEQKDQILTEMGVLAPRSGTYSTPQLIRLLKRETEAHPAQPLSLLILQMESGTSVSEELQTALYRHVAGVIKDSCRGFDLAGEYFNDKFAVVLPCTGINGARSLARRLHEKLGGLALKTKHGQVSLQVKIGIADYSDCRHYEDFLNKAMENLHAGALNRV